MSRIRSVLSLAWPGFAVIVVIALAGWQLVPAQQKPTPESVQPPVAAADDFATVMARMKAAKPEIQKKHAVLLEARYDLADRPAPAGAMSGGKLIQQGPRTRLADGMTWAKLAAFTPDEVRDRGLFPAGFLPLPHPNHPEGGMLFPKFHIDEIKKQEGRDLTRFDLDFDLRTTSCPSSRRRCA
ncbi:MAG: ccp 1 [Gemmataceae bacterium]|nr:ccp 1 [Gemmataceae bacterium]